MSLSSPLPQITPRDAALAMIVAALWGAHFVVIRIGALEIPPLLLLSIRFFLAALIFLPFIQAISKRQFIGLVSYAFPYLVLHLSTLFVGLKYLDAGLASLIIQLEIPFIIILGWLCFGEKFGLKTLAGLVLALAGVVLIVYQPLNPEFSYLGAGLVIFSAFAWSIGALRMRYIQDMSFASMTFYSHAFAFPFIAVLTFIMDERHLEQVMAADPVKLGIVLFYQVFLMSLCLHVWKGLMQRNPAYLVTPFTLLVPVFAVLSGILILDESLSVNAVAGGALVLAGVGIIVLRKMKKGLEADHIAP